MLNNRFAKLSVAGFAAIAGVILVASSVGANHTSAPRTMSSISGVTGTTVQVGADAAAEAAELAADAQAEAAELAAEQQKAAAEAAAEAAENAQDENETETETGDTETGDTETAAPTGTAAKTDD